MTVARSMQCLGQLIIDIICGFRREKASKIESENPLANGEQTSPYTEASGT